MQHLGHSYDLTGHAVFLFGKSGKPSASSNC